MQMVKLFVQKTKILVCSHSTWTGGIRQCGQGMRGQPFCNYAKTLFMDSLLKLLQR